MDRSLRRGESIERDELLHRLVEIQYERRDLELLRGTFRVRGDVVELFPAYEETAYRVEMSVSVRNAGTLPTLSARMTKVPLPFN